MLLYVLDAVGEWAQFRGFEISLQSATIGSLRARDRTGSSLVEMLRTLFMPKATVK